MAGLKDQVEGKAKEIKGKVTNDKKTEMEGNAQQVKGKVERRAGQAKDDLDAAIDNKRTEREHSSR